MKSVKYSLIVLLMMPGLAFSHARLKASGPTPPRNNSAGLKSAPCGGVAKGTPTELVAGSEITLQWEETIQHPGWYEFSVSYDNDENWTTILVVQDTQDNRNDLPHQYTATLKVPEVTCTNCTFRMIQVMTDRNPPTNYYSCADIRVVAGVEPPSQEMPEEVETPDPPPPSNDPTVKPSGSECH
jgi:hypothetical protein